MGINTTLPPKKSSLFGFVQHKKHIIKVMCLAAVVCPWIDTECCWMWDSKLGIWPFSHQVPAKKNSKNWPKGTLEWKGYPTTKKVCEMLLTKVAPAIEEKWPAGDWGQTITIQQSNAGLTLMTTMKSFVMLLNQKTGN